MLIKFYKESGKRLLSLLLALTLLLPNFTGIAVAADDDPDAGTICGIAAHVHDESCFESADQLVCGKEEGDTHAHVDTCHQSSSVLVCTVPESEEHAHGEDCYELQTVTICDQNADVPHAHDSICYQTVQKTICTQQEHTHAADCYAPATTDYKETSEPVTETSEPSTEISTTPTGNGTGDDATEPDPTTSVAPTTPLGALLTSPAPNTLATKNAPVESLTDISGYTVPIVIYNYLYRTGAAGESLVMSHDGVFGFTGNFGNTITIGGDTNQTDDNCKPTANNITVELQGLRVNNTVTIKDVYPGGDVANKTILNVTAASSIDTLVLESAALVEMNISADTTISNLVLAANSSLVINIAKDEKLTLTNASGGGSLWINGGSVEGNKISAAALNLNGVKEVAVSQLRASASMTLSGANITATDGTIVAPNIYATNSVIAGAKLFGFDHTITGTANMSFTGCHFNAIERVGAADDCTASVRFAVDCSVETDDVKSYVRDYTITYAVADEGENWLKSYRASSEKLAGDATVLTADRTLPQYTTPGYTYLGWLLAQDDENFIEELPKDQKGDLTLYPKTQPANIKITIDLMFDLEKEVFDAGDWVAAYNDNRIIDEDKGTKTSIKKLTQQLDTNLTLDIPNRFGYIFRGWKITGSDVTLSDTVTEYTIVYDQLTDKTKYTLNLEAVWLKDTFPLYWSFGGISLEYIEVSLDGGETWLEPEKVIETHGDIWTWEAESSSLRTKDAGEIAYGESLADYFTRLSKDLNKNLQYPIVRDKRTVSDKPEEVSAAQAFRNWYWIAKVQPVYESSTYDASETTGILYNAKDADTTWADFQTKNLQITNMITLGTQFGTANYDLNISANDHWTYQVNGVDKAPTDGKLVVPNGSKVTLVTAIDSGNTISNWELLSKTGVTVTQRYLGGNVVYYDFIMPACDVTAVYRATIPQAYIDIAKGAITFEEDTDPAGTGLKYDGFWHSQRLFNGTTENKGLNLLGMTPLAYDAQKGYFYIWDMSKPLYVTSDGVATTNQLTLVKTTTVYFNAVNLAANNTFKTQADGRCIYGYSVEKPEGTAASGSMDALSDNIAAAGGLAALGNVVLANDALVSQTFTLNFVGAENYVGAIVSDQYYSAFANTLYIKGAGETDTSLTLGTAFANCSISIQDMTLNEDPDILFSHILHANVAGASISLARASISAPTKEIYSKSSNISFGTSNRADAVSADIRMAVAGGRFSVGTNSNVRVRGDVLDGYQGMSMSTGSVVVIDGNYLTNYFHWSSTFNKGASGAVLIVKGNRCELGNTWWTSGTLICNALVLGRAGGVQGGTVIANQITNNPTGHWEIALGGTVYTYTDKGTALTNNGDQYPFQTYTQAAGGEAEYSFTAGQTYLLGYYDAPGGVYNTDIQVAHTPVQKILEVMLDGNGNYNNAAVPTAAALAAVQSSEHTESECVILGASHLNIATNNRIVNLGGTAEIYAAGNLNFFNDVNVSGNATIWCGGTFSTKNDMNIVGGTITAKEVGISYDLSELLDDTTYRWKKLSISEGKVISDRVGTLSQCTSDSSRGVRGVAVIDPSCVEARSKTEVQVEFDEYVNYMLGTAGFKNPESNSSLNSVHISGRITENVATYTADPTVFAPPAYGDNGIGQWKLKDTNGPVVTGVDANANLTPVATPQPDKAYSDDRLILVAMKDKYNIDVIAGSEHIEDLNGQGAVALTTGDADKLVTITIDSANNAANKTVVWYTDAVGNLCRPAEYTVNGNQVTFKMPYNDVEIYVAPEGIELDLSMHHVTITPDGFRTQLDDVISNREFHYTGNLTIKQSLSAETLYRIRVLEDVDNTAENRVFTLKQLKQARTTGDVGLKLDDGAKAHFKISGVVRLYRVEVPEQSEIILEAVEKDYAVNQLDVTSGDTTSSTNLAAFGNYYGKVGNITVKDLKLLPKSSQFNTWGYSSKKNSENTISYIGCSLEITRWYSSSYIARAVGTLRIEDCDFKITSASDWPSAIAYNCDNVEIVRSRINYLNVGGASGNTSTRAVTLAYGINNQLSIVDSHVTTTLRRSTETINYKVEVLADANAPIVVLRGDTVYQADPRSNYKRLILEDNSIFNAGGADHNGYLFAEKIEVRDNATLNAGTILVSGYLNQTVTTIEKVKETLASSTATIKDGVAGGLFITGGTVNVDAVGGDKNTVINVSGGVLNADRIGTQGFLYGYGLYTPEAHENWVEKHAKIPTGATVTVTGGTVNVDEYMGGMNADVNIQGGTVNLDTNAVLGMTDDHAQTLKAHYATLGLDVAEQDNINVNISGGEVLGADGTINTPYGNTNITGADTGVKVKRISAIYGDVSIQDSKGKYDNPMKGMEKIGVHVLDTLIAQNISITKGAQVFAKNALADAPLVSDQATLFVGDTSTIFTEVYGSSGQGGVKIEGSSENIVQKQRQYVITYVMNDDDMDRAKNDADNPDTFVYNPYIETATPVNLSEPSRDGFVFKGWYPVNNGVVAEHPIEGFSTSTNNDVVLHAKWEPIKVKFQIFVDKSKTFVGTDDELASMGDTISQKNGIVTFTKPVEVPYRANMFGTEGDTIILDDFNFPSYSILRLQVADQGMSQELDIASATVTRELLEAYQQKNLEPILLKAIGVSKKNEMLTMDLNIKNGRPVGAAFQPNDALSSGNTISARVAVGDKISSAQGLVINGKLNEPTAPGYDFVGWNTMADGTTGTTITEEYKVGGDNATRFFARWIPNQYEIEFDSDGGFVTRDNNSVLAGDAKLAAYVIYDQQIDGHISYTRGDRTGTNKLPFAWKPGYHFDGWSYTVNGETKLLSNTDEFNETTLGDMLLESSGSVITLKAVYSPVKVTYHTNGGIFTQTWLDKTGASNVDGAWVSEAKHGVTGYGLPLAGYVEEPAANRVYELFGTAEDAGKTFAVLSTTAEYYRDNHGYQTNDYRFDIGKKGYTFKGWNTDADGNGSYVGSLPAYKDIALYAIWSSNTYNLTLHKGDSQYSDLLSKFDEPESPRTITVTVGKTIDDSENWPDRDQWYAKAKAELVNAKTDERYLLGFTFDKLEPGAPSNDPNDTTSAHSIKYRNYAAFVTKLINNKALMTKTETISGGEAMIGSIFHLPANGEYNSGIISDTKAVPDYPNGYSIDMYAVYRERSLVFIQWYVDNNNQTREKVMYTAPITSVYNDYPAIYADSEENKQVMDQGYSLVRWAVNDVTGGAYTKGDYESKYEAWKNDAAAKGSYDVNVYTVYAAQVKDEIDLIVASSPAILYAETVYSIPGSMTIDYLHYQITNNTGGLELVSLKELENLRYTDRNQNKIAFSMELIDPNGVSTETIWLDENVDTDWYSTIMAGRGWKLRFRAYTSRVIKTTETLSFNLGITFKQEQSQTINLLTNVVMKPTLWTVKYTAHLPNEEHRYVDNNEYSGTSDFRTAIDNSWIYGSELKSSIPTVEGYDGYGKWRHSSGAEYDYGTPGTMKLTSPDTIEVTTAYKIKSYRLTNSTDGKCVVASENAVNYHAPVTLTPVDTKPEFIWLEYHDSRYRLDQLTDAYPFFATVNEGVYTILMPAGDVNVVYNDVMTLYLDEGTIEITENGYKHHKEKGTVTETWRGNYCILQDADNNTDFHSTTNVLKLSDDLSSRKIELGNLNITSNNSVVLTEGAKVNLNATGNIKAKNILVPGVTTALTLQSLNTTKYDVTLNPAENVAAIGGGNENGGNAGSIKLQNLNLTLNMPPDSMASGIGSGSVGAGVCGPIAINNCEITVMEGNEVGKDPYRGVWIGGQKADSINLSGVNMHNGGSGNVIALTDAKTVKIQNCNIGTPNNRIMNHLIRGGTVWVDNSDIYLSSGQETLIKPKDVFHVDANKAGTSIISITGYCEKLYDGRLQIHNAATDVVISTIRLLELNNGGIIITESGSKQSDVNVALSHDAGYRLLSAFDEYTGSSNVEIAGKSFVTAEANCAVNDLKISGDAELQPMGLMQASNVDIAANAKLKVTADGTAGLNPAAMSGKGSYSQTGGQLKSDNDLVIGGDMTLNGVTVETAKEVGSNGASGVTTVSITKSNIKATTIGAVGPQSESFTFVVLDDASELDGELVQDHYRLHYNLSDPNFKQVDGVPYATETESLPIVLRSETPYSNGTAGERTYLDAIPKNPHYKPATGSSYFSNWYIEAGSVKTALSSEDVPGFTQKTTLSDDSIQYAADTGDGTKTLEVYSWMNLNGTGLIAYGRELNLLNKNEMNSITQIETNGAWTARFDVSGVVLEGAEYRFTFDTAIPAGTKLTLRFGDTNPKYYRYVTTADTTVVKESDFILMGTDNSKAVLMGTVGTTMEHVLQLSADFEDAEAVAVANGVALTVQSNSGIHPIAKVNYTTKAMATAGCTATETTVSYSVAPNGDSRRSGSKLYLVAKLSTDNVSLSVPYGANLVWNGTTGTWLGGNMAYFPLNAYGEKNETGSWSVSGLEGGTYTITWYLTAASDNTQNVFEEVLASDNVTITTANQILPSLDVKLVNVDGSAVKNHVLNADDSHTIHFTFTTNGSDIRASLEKQGALQNFMQIEEIVTNTADSADITIPAGAGVYRIRFSLDGFGNTSSDWDDVYFTFILK